MDSVRVAFNQRMLFHASDVTIESIVGDPIPFQITGSGSTLMRLTLDDVLSMDSHTITLADTIHGTDSGIPLDGDEDGIPGGTAVFTLHHRCRPTSTRIASSPPAISRPSSLSG